MKGAGGGTERAGRALDLLCDERAAAVGHLYLFKGRKLKLAASRGGMAPPEDFHLFIQRFLAREIAESEAITRIIDDQNTGGNIGHTQFTDSRGVTYYAYLLRAVIGTEIRYTGLVALALERAEPPDQNLVLAVSTHFIQSGDTRGLEYGAWQPEVLG
jgi:hypothetical protein